VTALYEIIPSASLEVIPEIKLKYQQTVPEHREAEASDLATVALRWKNPGKSESRSFEQRILQSEFLKNPPDNFRWASAAAEFALVLGKSENAPEATVQGALAMAKSTDYQKDSYRREFVEMLTKYRAR
jgi:Ca-activated chloride channel family protein